MASSSCLVNSTRSVGAITIPFGCGVVPPSFSSRVGDNRDESHQRHQSLVLNRAMNLPGYGRWRWRWHRSPRKQGEPLAGDFE